MGLGTGSDRKRILCALSCKKTTGHNYFEFLEYLVLQHFDVSVRECTFCLPFLITAIQKNVVFELSDAVAKYRFV